MTRDLTQARVTVAVLTYLRLNDLAALLPILVNQTTDASADCGQIRVLVVDNDPAGGAVHTVRGFTDRGVRYVHEPVPGITAGRNRALDECMADDILIFIDDDERPDDGWLVALLEVWSRSSAAAVVGPVRSEFTGDLDPWIAAGAFFRRRRLTTGAPVVVAATNNLLLDLATVRRLDLKFDERFGLSGAEDTFFTRSLSRAGESLVWCAEAMVTDVVPAARMTRRWVLNRAFSSGNAAVLTSVELEASLSGRARQRAVGLVNGSVRSAAGAARYGLGLVSRSPHHQTRGARTAMRGLGMLAGAAGLVYLEYARASPTRTRLRRFTSLHRHQQLG